MSCRASDHPRRHPVVGRAADRRTDGEGGRLCAGRDGGLGLGIRLRLGCNAGEGRRRVRGPRVPEHVPADRQERRVRLRRPPRRASDRPAAHRAQPRRRGPAHHQMGKKREEKMYMEAQSCDAHSRGVAMPCRRCRGARRGKPWWPWTPGCGGARRRWPRWRGCWRWQRSASRRPGMTGHRCGGAASCCGPSGETTTARRSRAAPPSRRNEATSGSSGSFSL